jgi:hypothetical protein
VRTTTAAGTRSADVTTATTVTATTTMTTAAACLSDRSHGEAGQNENRQGCEDQFAE